MENEKKETKKLLGILLISGIGFFPLLLFIGLFFVVFLFAVFTLNNNESYGGYCSKNGSVDMDVFSSTLATAGVFAGKEDVFIEVANKYQIDPVLLASIAIIETGWGKSDLVVNKNNPGGLYNSKAKTFYSFDTLEEGLDIMGQVLHKHIVVNGLNTIEKLGNVYAPIGAANDPNNLNVHWVPNVTKVATQLGGLTMNCESGQIVNLGGSFNIPTTSPFRVNSHYGWRNIGSGNELHGGIDLHCTLGEAILAAKEGTVVESTTHYSYGNYVVIQHEGGYKTVYAHLNKRLVDIGDTVSAGTVVGQCGSTGRSTGPHLHFEVRLPSGQRVDPYPYLVVQN